MPWPCPTKDPSLPSSAGSWSVNKKRREEDSKMDGPGPELAETCYEWSRSERHPYKWPKKYMGFRWVSFTPTLFNSAVKRAHTFFTSDGAHLRRILKLLWNGWCLNSTQLFPICASQIGWFPYKDHLVLYHFVGMKIQLCCFSRYCWWKISCTGWNGEYPHF